MKKEHDRPISFSAFYMRGFCMKEAGKRLKMILLLSVIFAAAAIFSVVNSINKVNRKCFLKNCCFETINIENEPAEDTFPYFTASIITVGDGGVQADIGLFTGEHGNNVPFFSKKNRLRGTFGEDENTIWLTYNTARELNAKPGDNVCVKIRDEAESREIELGDFTVDGIFLPFGGSFQENTLDEYLGFANVFLSDRGTAEADGHAALYLSFDTDTLNGSMLKKEQLFCKSKLSADYVGNVVNYAFPIAAAVIAAIVIGMEFMQYYRYGRRRFALLNALGVREGTLRRIHFLLFSVCCLTAAIVSVLLFRFTMMNLVGKYVPLRLCAEIAAAELVISIAVVCFCIFAVGRSPLTSVLFEDDINGSAREK